MNKLIIAALVVATAFTACKKGKEDPIISFKSRDTRLAGEWKLSARADSTITTSTQKYAATSSLGAYSELTKTVETITFDGSSLTTNSNTDWSTTEPGLLAGSPTKINVTGKKVESKAWDITINKDGTYSWKGTSKTNPTSSTTTQTSTPSQICGVGIAPTPFTFGSNSYLSCDGTYTYSFPASYDNTSEGSDTWAWLTSGKNKSEIVFNGGPLGGLWSVLQLKSKEIKLVAVSVSNSTSTSPSGTDLVTRSSSNWTLTSK